MHEEKEAVGVGERRRAGAVIGARGLPGLLLICNIFWERSNAAYTAANVVIRTVREARLRHPFSSNCAPCDSRVPPDHKWFSRANGPHLGTAGLREQSQPASRYTVGDSQQHAWAMGRSGDCLPTLIEGRWPQDSSHSFVACSPRLRHGGTA